MIFIQAALPRTRAVAAVEAACDRRCHSGNRGISDAPFIVIAVLNAVTMVTGSRAPTAVVCIGISPYLPAVATCYGFYSAKSFHFAWKRRCFN